jgi:hypothetical protein
VARRRLTVLLDQWNHLFERDHLLLHKAEKGERIRTLGMQFNEHDFSSGTTDERFAKVYLGVQGLLDRGCVCGWAVEAVIGHMTCCGLSNRDTLAALYVVHRFIQASYSTPTRLWAGAKAELIAFQGLMICMQSTWWTPWSTLVSQSDKSLDGWGLKAAHATTYGPRRSSGSLPTARCRKGDSPRPVLLPEEDVHQLAVQGSVDDVHKAVGGELVAPAKQDGHPGAQRSRRVRHGLSTEGPVHRPPPRTATYVVAERRRRLLTSVACNESRAPKGDRRWCRPRNRRRPHRPVKQAA